MKIAHAFRAAAHAFKAVLGTAYGAEAAYWDDWFRNGWAAVASGWGAFWGALRDWGGTDYAALAASAAANPHAARGLRLLCEAGAAVPLLGYRGDDEADGLPALAAVEKAGWASLWTPFVWGAYCGGEAFVHRVTRQTGPAEGRGAVIALRLLRNERFVRVEADAAGDPTAYVFTRPRGGTETFPAKDVLHVKFFNALDPERGLPLLLGARRALTLVEEADAWNRGIARGGGRVPGYWSPRHLEAGQQLRPEDQERAQAWFDERAARAKARNAEMVLSGAFERVQGDVTPREADWLKGRQVAMREVAAVLGVPATLLADEKAGSLTDAGVDSEVAALYKLTIQPLLERFLDELSRWLCAEGERIAADWDQVPALQEDQDAKFKRYADPHLPLTRKERRVALGYDPEPAPDMEDDEAAPAPEPVAPPRMRLVEADELGGVRAALRAHFTREAAANAGAEG